MRSVASVNVERTLGDKPVGLSALAQLFRDLNRQGMRYCAWKSNVRLEESLRGETDLDILVDRSHAANFAEALATHDIKRVEAAAGRHYPAIENYLGFDTSSGKIFHLHVHYQLILGERFVKNYRFPLEKWFLDWVQMHHGVKTPVPEVELAVLALRAMLKYRLRDAIKDVLGIRTPGIPPAVVGEICFLRERCHWKRVSEALEEVADIVPAATVLSFLETIEIAARSGLRLWRLRVRLRREVNSYRRHQPFGATVRYFGGSLRQTKWMLKVRPGRRMTLPRGGVVLALFGADGAGKTTLAQTLVRWLEWRLDVRTFYMGSKQPSVSSRLFYLAFRSLRRGSRALARFLPEKNVVVTLAERLRDEALLCLHHLAIAYDRYRRYRSGREEALRGSVVIYDRFPLMCETGSRDWLLLDGPQVPSSCRKTAGLVHVMERLERFLYKKILPPDYLFSVEVSPTVAFQRKPDHDPATITAKAEAAKRVATVVGRAPASSSVIRINADRPLEHVVGDLKRAVWEIL